MQGNSPRCDLQARITRHFGKQVQGQDPTSFQRGKQNQTETTTTMTRSGPVHRVGNQQDGFRRSSGPTQRIKQG